MSSIVNSIVFPLLEGLVMQSTHVHIKVVENEGDPAAVYSQSSFPLSLSSSSSLPLGTQPRHSQQVPVILSDFAQALRSPPGPLELPHIVRDMICAPCSSHDHSSMFWSPARKSTSSLHPSGTSSTVARQGGTHIVEKRAEGSSTRKLAVMNQLFEMRGFRSLWLPLDAMLILGIENGSWVEMSRVEDAASTHSVRNSRESVQLSVGAHGPSKVVGADGRSSSNNTAENDEDASSDENTHAESSYRDSRADSVSSSSESTQTEPVISTANTDSSDPRGPKHVHPQHVQNERSSLLKVCPPSAPAHGRTVYLAQAFCSPESVPYGVLSYWLFFYLRDYADTDVVRVKIRRYMRREEGRLMSLVPRPARAVYVSQVNTAIPGVHFEEALKAFFASPQLLAVGDVFGVKIDRDTYCYFIVNRIDTDEPNCLGSLICKDSCALYLHGYRNAYVPFWAFHIPRYAVGMQATYLRTLNLIESLLDPSLPLIRSLLIRGPRGCGKYVLVETVAAHTGVHLLTLNCWELSGESPGKMDLRIRDLGRRAVALRPCILLLRNVDVLGTSSAQDPHRSQGITRIVSSINELITNMSNITCCSGGLQHPCQDKGYGNNEYGGNSSGDGSTRGINGGGGVTGGKSLQGVARGHQAGWDASTAGHNALGYGDGGSKPCDFAVVVVATTSLSTSNSSEILECFVNDVQVSK